jgi:hypothetical protein
MFAKLTNSQTTVNGNVCLTEKVKCNCNCIYCNMYSTRSQISNNTNSRCNCLYSATYQKSNLFCFGSCCCAASKIQIFEYRYDSTVVSIEYRYAEYISRDRKGILLSVLVLQNIHPIITAFDYGIQDDERELVFRLHYLFLQRTEDVV